MAGTTLGTYQAGPGVFRPAQSVSVLADPVPVTQSTVVTPPWRGAIWVSTTVTTQASFSATHVYQLPTVAIGDRLVLVASCLDGVASFTPTTDLSAWTSFLASELNAFHCWRGYTIYIADAAAVTAWSGTTVTFASANGGKSTAVVERVAFGASGGVGVGFDFAGPTTTGSDNQPNPPQVVPTWGFDQNLWMAFATFGSAGDAATQAPLDYHDLAQGGAAADQTTTAVAIRETIAGGEDPGAFILAGAENWQALTFAVRPVVAAAAPVAGSTSGPLTVVGRITGTKVATGSTRAAAPVVARPTGAKVAASSVRALAPVTATPTGAKIAQAATVAAQAVIGRFTGAAVSNTVQGAATFLAATTARITGTKTSPGATLATVPTVARITTTKIGTGTTRALAPVTARPTGIKVAGGAARALAATIARATGTKTTTSGAARAVVPATVSATAAKLAVGAVLTVAPVVARITLTAPGAGAVRVAVAVVARITGTKTTTAGGVRAVAPTVARAAGTKTAPGGAVRAVAPVVARATAAKLAAGASTVAAPVVARVSTLKRATGATVVPATVSAAAAGVKTGRGTVRAAWAVIVKTPSRAPVEAWSWYVRRSGAWLPASPKLDGVHPTSTDVT